MNQGDASIEEARSPFERIRELIPYNREVAHYNAAVIRSKTNPADFLILVREVPLAQIQAGTPDKGNLAIYRSTPSTVEKITEIPLQDPRISNWEDARAFTSEEVIVNEGQERQEVLLGLTAVKAADNQPTAAFIRGEVINGDFKINRDSLVICLEDEGKNTTPISLNLALFRRNGESDEIRHSLEVVEVQTSDKGEVSLKDRIKKIIHFPKKPWCDWQIGTQAQMLPDGILPIHGVNRFSLGVNPDTGKEVYGFTYSLGLAQLDENLDVVKISHINNELDTLTIK